MTKPETKPDTITLRRDALPGLVNAIAHLSEGNDRHSPVSLRGAIIAAITAAGVPEQETSSARAWTGRCATCGSKACCGTPDFTAPLPASAGTEKAARTCPFLLCPKGHMGEAGVRPAGRLDCPHCDAGREGRPRMSLVCVCVDADRLPIPDAPKPQCGYVDAIYGARCVRAHCDLEHWIPVPQGASKPAADRPCAGCGYSWERCCGRLENVGDRCCSACAHPGTSKPVASNEPANLGLDNLPVLRRVTHADKQHVAELLANVALDSTLLRTELRTGDELPCVATDSTEEDFFDHEVTPQPLESCYRRRFPHDHSECVRELKAQLDEAACCGIVVGSWTEYGQMFVDVCDLPRPCKDHPADAWLVEKGRADAAEEALAKLKAQAATPLDAQALADVLWSELPELHRYQMRDAGTARIRAIIERAAGRRG